uniref:UDP-glucuronosyltransferase 2B1 n=1 Tax=Cacopsylla melanoneura TaxID=428564 RepID=A0A8D8XBM5_9HEMI
MFPSSYLLAGLLFLLIPSHLDGARILIVLPLPLWSHYQQFHLLWETLAQRGHEVTVYSAFPPTEVIPNFKHVNFTMTKSKEIFDTWNHSEVIKDQFVSSKMYEVTEFWYRFHTQRAIFNFGLLLSKEIFAHPTFHDLLESNEKYDLIITENFFGQESLAVLGHKFKAPIIAETSHGTPPNCYLLMGNPNLYSYIPDFKFTYSSRMNFMQRLQNTALGVLTHIVGDFWYFPQQDAIMRQFSKPGDNLPYIKTMMQNISATLIYSDPILEFQRPQVSNLIHVGGIHLKEEKLPKDLEDIMTKSASGVIYVSFGSIIQPGKMSSEMQEQLFDAFSKIGLTVLWRWKGDLPENVPKNIILRSWFPQQAVLAHSNCRLFISHGGLNSVLESIHYAVPMVGIPFYGDQPSNIKHMVDLGSAVELEYHNMTEKSIVWAAKTILNNRRFKFAAIQARQRFNDRQVPPLHNAVWWVEYVLRHHGAPHLRSAFDHLSWTEFLLLDVVAFVLGVLLVILYLLLRIVRAVKSCLMYPFRGTGNEKTKTIKKKGKVE